MAFGELAQAAEVGARQLGVGGPGRHGHESGEAQVFGFAQDGDDFRDSLGERAGLGLFTPELHFHHDVQRSGGLFGEAPGKFQRIYCLDRTKDFGGPVRFIGLEAADEVIAGAGETGDFGVLAFKFLDVVLAEVSQAEGVSLMNCGRGELFRHGEERDAGWVAMGAFGGLPDAGPHLFQTMSEHSNQYTVAASLTEAIGGFIGRCRRPVLIEPGYDPVPLTADSYALEQREDSVTLEAWSEQRNLSRRVVGIEGETRGRLALSVERFGKKAGILILLDQEAPRGVETARRLSRLTFRERFRRAVARRFPGWRVAELTMETDLAHTLTSNFPRALVRKGATAWAAIGAEHEADAVLTHGLIWLDYLRARERRHFIEGLLLYLPAGRERTTCLRLRWLNPRAAQYEVLAFTGDGYEDAVDLRDYGNLDTRVETCREYAEWSSEIQPLVERLRAVPGVECLPRGDGSVGLRVRGLEFARATPDRLLWGIGTKRPARASNADEIACLAEQLGRFRSDGARDRGHPLYQRNPEAWLESQVRANLRELDPRLDPAPVYGQVPQFTGGERDVIDLLAVNGDGRLVVIELKATEDVHLPMQALDYWIRVRWHAARGDFGANGYFRGMNLRTDAPRLLLAAPALEFHPTNEKVLRYFAPEVEVERIGVGMEWRRELKVMFRYRG